MKKREYFRKDADGNFIRAYPVNSEWEIEIVFQGKTLKYGASNCNRTFWDNRKHALKVANSIFYRGIDVVYAEEHRRQFGY